MGAWQLSAVAFLLCAASAVAHPIYWVERHSPNCTQHPQEAYKFHQAPVLDSGATHFALIGDPYRGGGEVCPGYPYVIKVEFDNSTREALLTSTLGSFDGADTTCPNRRVFLGPQASWNATLNVPCSAPAGTPILVFVTSASGKTSAYYQKSVNLKTADCANPACKNMPSPPAAKPPPPPPKNAALTLRIPTLLSIVPSFLALLAVWRAI